MNGEKCKQAHPQRCKRYCNFGTNTKSGCTRGKNCKYWHPRLCKFSLKDSRCTNADCTFFHLKGTRRTAAPLADEKKKEEKEASGEAPGNGIHQRMRFSSIASLATPYPATIQKRHQPPPKTDKNQVREPESFLLKMMEELKDGIVSRMEEQMTQLRSSIPGIVKELALQHLAPHMQPPQMHVPIQHPPFHAPHMMPYAHTTNQFQFPASTY